jgi:very-short-patch-repair endonuclease
MEPSSRIARARSLRRGMTDAERRLWHELRDRRLAEHKFVRQEPLGPYFADFCCRAAKLVVEVDGSQQADSARDAVRDAHLTGLGYRILRFWNHEIFREMEVVKDTILAGIEDYPSAAPHPDPLPACGERGIPRDAPHHASPSPPIGGEGRGEGAAGHGAQAQQGDIR